MINPEMIKKVSVFLQMDEAIIQPLIVELESIWQIVEKSAHFPCLDNCSDCCSNSAITCTALEYAIASQLYNYSGNNGFGCFFKNKNKCSVYDHRPLVCRLFGYRLTFDPSVVIFREKLLEQPLELSVAAPNFCVKRKVISPLTEDEMNQVVNKYQKIVEATKIVMLGTFKDKQLNGGLQGIDKCWQAQFGKKFWIR